jgi:hypothetical protein
MNRARGSPEGLDVVLLAKYHVVGEADAVAVTLSEVDVQPEH